jgi:signal transduction histidine kinase
VSLHFKADKEKIIAMDGKLKQQESYTIGLENSLDSLSFLANQYLHLSSTEGINLSKIVADSKASLFKEAYEAEVNCAMSLSCDKTVDQETAKTLYLLLINYLFRAIHRTPKNGKVNIKVKKAHGLVNIHIQDHGFNLKDNLLPNTKHIFYLNDNILAELADRVEIGLTKKQSAQNNIIDIFLPEKQESITDNNQGEKVVILFPNK